MIVTILFRRGSSTEWAAANPVLDSGEPGYDQTTGQFKIGDGATQWTELKPLGGSVVSAYFNVEWPARPVADAGVTVMWIDTSGLGGVPPAAIPGIDIVIAQATP